VTIGKLSDEVLLAIFRYYLDECPRLWPRLVHICRKWRRLVFASKRDLHLRLFCTHGTPVMKALNCWPALPIVVQYGGSLELDAPAPEDDDDIIAALKHSNRVTSISVTITNPLLEKLSAIERPFSELEDLILFSHDSVLPTLPSAFGRGTRLRRLHLTRLAFSAIPLLLYSSMNLVDLRLHEVPNPWLSSPEALTDALSEMALLQSLSLHFLPTGRLGVSPPSRKRVVLPSLTLFDFQGITKYLEDFLAGINAPLLGDIEATFFKEDIMSDLSQLGKFIDRMKIHKSYPQAHILSSERSISISFIQPGVPTSIRLHVLCELFSEQLYSMTRLFILFSAFLAYVEDLRISTTRQPTQEDDAYSGEWSRSINLFRGVKWFHLDGSSSMTIVRALQQPNETVLPAMHKLYVPPMPRHALLSEEVVSLMTSRRLSGRPIAVEYGRRCESHGTGTILRSAPTTTH
jgi:hypothetical protein